jgi:hypothetical protein
VKPISLNSFEQANSDLKRSLKHSVDILDLENVHLYTTFEKPLVAVVTTHPSINDVGRNLDFYRLIVKALVRGGLE